ncbi:MAG TPA: PAS domain-containing protein [Methanospirillum sp.]|nr:PAS domain-containing protein [Methanospirillum sp.]
MVKIPALSELSFKHLISLVILTALILSVLISSYASYTSIDTYIIHEFNRQVNGSEEYLVSSTTYIHHGLKLWDTTYDQTVMDLAERVAASYYANDNNISAINLSQIAQEVPKIYLGKIEINIINESGMINATYGGKLGQDFSGWGVFFDDLTSIRNGQEYVPDRVVNGFNTSAPLMKYGYLPTEDHRFVIEPAINVSTDQKSERSNLSYLSLMSRAQDLNSDIIGISFYNSMFKQVFVTTREQGPWNYSWRKDAVPKVFKTHLLEEHIDERNNTLVRYRYLPIQEDNSPSSRYMDMVAEFVYTTERVEKQRNTNAILHIILAIIAISFVIIIGYLILSRLTRPIQQIVEDIDRISSGDLTHSVRKSSHAEINRIAEAINQMVAQIHFHMRTIKVSESRYFGLFRTSADAIIILEGSTVIAMNRAATDLLKVTEQDSVGKPITAIFGKIGETISEMIGSGSSGAYEGYSERTIILSTGKEEMFLNLRLTQVEAEEQLLNQVQIRDMSDQRRMYIANAERDVLRTSYMQIQTILHLLPDPTFIIDNSGVVLIWNQAMETMTGVAASEMIGKGEQAYAVALYGHHREMLIDVALHHDERRQTQYPNIEQHGGVFRTNIWLEGKEQRRYVSAIASKISDSHGNFIGAIESIRDITSLKLTGEALAIANNKLNLLSTITRHDVLNKVMIVKMNLYLLDGLILNQDQQDSMMVISRSLASIEQFVAFTKMYQDIGVKDPIWQNIGEVFDHVQRQLDPGNVQITISVWNLLVYADPLFEKVCYNLIENAIRHGGKITEIQVYAQESGNELLVSVQDDGDGVHDDSKEIIFERGYGKNTGYGLFLTREILSMSGISIQEKGVYGKGCRFEIQIPSDRYHAK